MKNYRVSIRKKLIIIIAFFQISYNIAAQEVSTEWSGSASYSTRHQKYVTGDFVNIKNAVENKLLAEYHTEATIVNGVGVAKSRIKKSYWAKDPRIVALDQPPSYCFTTEEGSGESSAEATLLISMGDGYYSFSISTPEVNAVITGTQNCSGDKPASSGSHHTEPGFNLTPEVDQLLKDSNVLEGEIVVRFGQPVFPDGPVISTDKFSWWEESANAGPISGEFFEKIIKWHFVRAVPEDVELIITPKQYDSWLPDPGMPEEKHGKPMEVELKLKHKNAGKKGLIKAEAFEVTLVNTSAEPGRTINYPIVREAKEPFDIQLHNAGAKAAQGDGQQLTLRPQSDQSATLWVVPYDGGGYTTLQAKATLSDGRVITGKLLSSTGPADVLIPKRPEGRLIASAWLRQDQSDSDKEDDEKSKGNNNNGDGLSAYEEYRGIYSQEKFTRLDNKKKHLMVQVAETDLPVFKEGLELLARAADIIVLPLKENELNRQRVVNANNSSVHNGDQYAHILLNRSIAGLSKNKPYGGVGLSMPAEKARKTIKETDSTIVDVEEIKKKVSENENVVIKYIESEKKDLEEEKKKIAEALKKGLKPPKPKKRDPLPQLPFYTDKAEIRNTVAHELAHGLTVLHHGDLGNDAPRPMNNYPGTTQVIAYGSNELNMGYPQHYMFPSTEAIGQPEGLSSGDLSCIMVYTSVYQWGRIVEPRIRIHYYAVPIMKPGDHFCKSPAATGINLKPYYFGHAAEGRGNCLAQIRIKVY